MRRRTGAMGSFLVVLCLLTTVLQPLSWAETPPGKTTLLFASVEEGRRTLQTGDDYAERLSPFDRSARLKTDRWVSVQEYLTFVDRQVLAWEEGERQVVESAFLHIRAALERLAPDLGAVQLIRTTGEEEGNAAYTRDSAIVLPTPMLKGTGRALERLLAHELFHILSRNHPALRTALYAAIGFRPCGGNELPPLLRLRKITNPDAPGSDYCIRVEVEGKTVSVVPVLYSRTGQYDPQQGGDFLDYIQFSLMVAGDGSSASTPEFPREVPRLLGVSEVSGFFEQVGRNTPYIIHPEEILADNFAILVMGDRHVPSPEILEKMEEILRKEEVSSPAK